MRGYKYFVSFAHSRGFGNAVMTLEVKWEYDDENHLMVQKYLTDENDFAEVVVLNFVYLGKSK